MDYKKHYDILINSRKNLPRIRTKEIYYEKHHILPRCLGGTNAPENLILLTAKEHFIAHLLLTKIYTTKNEKIKMYWAFWHMCLTSKTNKRKISASQYEYGKLLIRIKGRFFSEETKRKMSKKAKERIVSDEVRQKINLKISLNNKGKKKKFSRRKSVPKSNEHKSKISAALLGRRLSEQHKINIINSKQNISLETRQKISKGLSIYYQEKYK